MLNFFMIDWELGFVIQQVTKIPHRSQVIIRKIVFRNTVSKLPNWGNGITL